MNNLYFICEKCKCRGSEYDFNLKLTSIMFSVKHNTMQAFTLLKCWNCNEMATYVYEKFPADLTKCGGFKK